MNAIKLPRMDCETVSREIGNFVIQSVQAVGATGCVVGLSGGIDSSTTAALINNAFAGANQKKDTPLELIKVLRPQVLAKGGDYTADEVVGKELVESWEGRVELVQFVDGKSTSRTIEKILEQYREE